MKRKRIIIILIVLGVLAAVLMFLNLSRQDKSRPQLDVIFNNNLQIVELSQLAAEDASIYDLRVVAAGLSATTSSDSQQLISYYQDRYGKEPKEVKVAEGSGPLGELEATEAGAGFDNVYKDKTMELLAANLNTIRAVFEETTRPSLRELLQAIFENQSDAYQELQDSS